MTSLTVAAAGRCGSPVSCIAAARSSVVPGETRNCAPAESACLACSGTTIVPAPTRMSGTLLAICSMQSSAAGVRRVSSITGTPPSTRARATGTAWATSSSTTTGMTGTRSSNDSGIEVLHETVGREHAGTLVGRADVGAEGGEKLPSRPEDQRVVSPGDGPVLEVVRRDVHVEQAGVGVEADQVAVLHPGEWSADRCLRGEVDGSRDLARRTRHPAVGDERDPLAAVLEDPEGRGQLVQLRHPVGRRALEADHRHEVALEGTGLEGTQEVGLVVEDPGRCLHLALLGLDRRGLDHRTAEVAVEHP